MTQVPIITPRQSFWQRIKPYLRLHPVVQAAIITGLLAFAGMWWRSNSESSILRTKVTEQNQKIASQRADIQRLETQLTPFKTIALEKFTGSEQEALRKLAYELDELKSYMDPFKKPIASATAHVEVTIKSKEQVDTKYMNENKNRKNSEAPTVSNFVSSTFVVAGTIL